MTRFQKIVVALLTVNMLATVGLYLRLDSQELLLEKEVRSMKRDILVTRYDDTNLKNSLASLEKQVGKLGEDTRKAMEKPEVPAPKPEQPAPKTKATGIQGFLDQLFGK